MRLHQQLAPRQRTTARTAVPRERRGTSRQRIEHHHNFVDAVILVHQKLPIAPVRNTFSTDAGILAGVTRGANRTQKGERFSALWIGYLEQ